MDRVKQLYLLTGMILPDLDPIDSTTYVPFLSTGLCLAYLSKMLSILLIEVKEITQVLWLMTWY
jgi:hypothetical protein